MGGWLWRTSACRSESPWNSAPTAWKWSKSLTFVWLKLSWEPDVIHYIYHLITRFCWPSFCFLSSFYITTWFCVRFLIFFLLLFQPEESLLSSSVPLHTHTDTHIQTWKLSSVITLFPLTQNLKVPASKRWDEEVQMFYKKVWRNCRKL